MFGPWHQIVKADILALFCVTSNSQSLFQALFTQGNKKLFHQTL